MAYAGVAREDRLAAGITDGLVRLSVECETTDHALADLDHALEAVCAGWRSR